MCVCVCVCVCFSLIKHLSVVWPRRSKHRSLSETVYWKRFVFWEWETARWTNIDTELFEVIFGSVVWMCFYRERTHTHTHTHTHSLTHSHTHTDATTLHLIGKSHLFPFVLQQSSGRAERFLIENRGLVTLTVWDLSYLNPSQLTFITGLEAFGFMFRKKKASGNDLQSLYSELLWK